MSDKPKGITVWRGVLAAWLALAGTVLAQKPPAPKRGDYRPPDQCWNLSGSECEQSATCKPSYWMCDYIPPGKTFQEVCPHGGKGFCEPRSPEEFCPLLTPEACAQASTSCEPAACACTAADARCANGRATVCQAKARGGGEAQANPPKTPAPLPPCPPPVPDTSRKPKAPPTPRR